MLLLLELSNFTEESFCIQTQIAFFHKRPAIVADEPHFSFYIKDHDIFRDIIQYKIVHLHPSFLLQICPYHSPLNLILTIYNEDNVKYMGHSSYQIRIPMSSIIMKSIARTHNNRCNRRNNLEPPFLNNQRHQQGSPGEA